MKSRQLSSVQVAAVLINTINAVGIMIIPRIAVEAADTGAPLLVLLGTLVGFIAVLLITVLGVRFPNKTIVEYAETILGRSVAFLPSLSVAVLFAVLTAFVSREFGEVIVSSVLKRTPLEVTVIIMLLLAAMSSRYKESTFANIHFFYFPFIFVPGLAIIAMSFKNANTFNLLPILGNEHHAWVSGILTVAAVFEFSFIMTLIIPFMRSPRKAYKAMFWGYGVITCIYLFDVTATLSVFGSEEIKLLMWPSLELWKTTSLPANILERLDAAYLAVWVTAVFTTLFSGYFLTVKSISYLFHLKDHKIFSFFILPFIFLIAMMPQSVLQMYEVVVVIGRSGLVITIGYPALLLVIAAIRKKKGTS